MWNVLEQHKRTTSLLFVVTLAALLMACATERLDVDTTRAAICPRPMSAERLIEVAAAIERLPASPELDLIAQELDRLDIGADLCDGN